MKYDAFFFDFDGVLADSVEVKTEAFGQLFESYGKDIKEKVIKYHRKNGGVSRSEKFKYYYKHFLNKPITDDIISHLSKEFSKLVVKKVIQCDEIPGAKNFLKQWYKVVPCYVISAAPDEELNEIVKNRKLTPFFKEIYGSSKLKHEHLYIIIKKYMYNPKNCIFWGDAISDYKASLHCGVPFRGIVKKRSSPLINSFPDIKYSDNFYNLSI